MHRTVVSRMRASLVIIGFSTAAAAAAGVTEIDRSRYMSPDEVRAGMKGVGRTVMSGTRIDTFNFEVVGVMRNAYYAQQDVILVRCSGLNLEHSGIIAGMSGSPCYVRDDSGRERMIGAVAYGWTFNKDPLCGVQPITQMLPIPDLRAPKTQPAEEPSPATATASGGSDGTGVSLGELIARAWEEPFDKDSRFSAFNDDILKARRTGTQFPRPAEGLQPLSIPVTVSSTNPHTLALLRHRLARFGMTPVSSGGAGQVTAAERPQLEPGSALCVPFMTGDLVMQGLGTCTEVIGDRVLGFGHAMFGEGSVELPLATGVVHTVVPSVARSEKVGAALEVVGTLWGDESSGIFGIRGKPAEMVPVDVIIRDLRGERTFHYNVLQDRVFTGTIVGTAVTESIYAHSEPPKEHAVRYTVETEFKDIGTFRTANFTSQSGTGGAISDTGMPILALMNAPFGRAKLARVRVEVSIEEGARAADLDEARLPKTTYKPGATVTAHVRWRHPYRTPQYTTAEYDLVLPADLPDGDYDLTLGSAGARISALRTEKPHLFKVDSLAKMLKAFNLMGALPDNRVYMSLNLARGGLAVNSVEMPELPSYQQQILLGSKRTDINKFTESLVTQHETEYAVSGSSSFKITVSRRADQ